MPQQTDAFQKKDTSTVSFIMLNIKEGIRIRMNINLRCLANLFYISLNLKVLSVRKKV